MVVHVDEKEEWAIVALRFYPMGKRRKGPPGNPSLGMRWLGPTKKGMPLSTGHPVWFIIPIQLTTSILSGLPLGHMERAALDDFLSDKIEEDELVRMWGKRGRWR